MIVLKHLKPFFWIANIALICVTPLALMFAYSPFHDVDDFFRLAYAITLRVPKNVRLNHARLFILVVYT